MTTTEHPSAGLDEHPERLRAILNELKEVVFQTDSEGRWIFLNPAWSEITGFTLEESLGKCFLDYVHPDDRERNLEKFRPLMERRKSYCRHEVRYVTRDGGYRWLAVHARSSLDDAGNATGTSGTLFDVTDRLTAIEELREARERLEVVLASSTVIVYTGKKVAGKFQNTYVSESVREMLGDEPAGFLQQQWIDRIHPEDVPLALASFAELERTGFSSFRARSRHRDGSYRWLRSDSRLLRDANGDLEVFGCCVDETKAQEDDEERRRYTAILEAVSFAAERVLDSSWPEAVAVISDRIGQATRASRVGVCRKRAGTEAAFTLECEWAAADVQRLDAGVDSLHLPCLLLESGGFLERLGRGEAAVASIDGAREPVVDQLRSMGLHCFLAVPIFVDKIWWGFIWVGHSTTGRNWWRAEITALTAAAGILGNGIKRNETEATLRYSEALLRTMAESSPLGFYVADHRTGRVLYMNDRFRQIWRVPEDVWRRWRERPSGAEAIGHCAQSAINGRHFESAEQQLAAEENRTTVDEGIALEDGRTIRWFSTQIRDNEDRYFGRLHLFEDITSRVNAEFALQRSRDELEEAVRGRTAELEIVNSRLRAEIAQRRSAEEELAKREQRFRALIENTLEGVFVVDTAATIRYASPSAKAVLGHEVQDLVGRSCFDFIHPADLDRVQTTFVQSLSVPGTNPTIEFRARDNQEAWRQLEAVGNNQLANPAVQGIVVTFRDITEKRHLEQQFRHAQKMEAVGRLAGGVAHDFNNLLTVISGYSDLMLKRLEENHPLRRNLGQIQRAAERAASLVKQLLAFSRKQVIEPEVMDINTRVTDLESMLRRLIGEDVELSVKVDPEPLFIKMDPSQFEQIVINLTVNARDAMPDGGVLTIGTSAHTPRGEFRCRDCKVAAGGYAVLAVRDTGTGMSEEVQARMFDPFFTTKEVGKGTGLGLAMVYGAVEQAGGHICVDSAIDAGSTFRICLPLSGEANVNGRPKPSVEPCESGQGAVLLVEDEELVRMIAAECLRDAGYTVLEARHGEQALQVMADYDGPIDVLVTDVIMPRMGGPELAAKVRQLRPHIAVALMSGYPEDKLPLGIPFLKKPFTTGELLSQVARLVPSRARPAGQVG